MAKSAAKSLATYLAAGWDDFAAPPPVFAYYLHKGYVYLCGALQSRSDGSTTQTLVSGLPVEARPPVDTPLTLRVISIDSDYVANPALDFPRTLAATVRASDGRIALDAALPAWVNAPPDPTVWWRVNNQLDSTHVALYPNPLTLVLLLGGQSWPQPGSPPMDAPAEAALAAYLGADFDDVDSWYSVHGSRVHLGGHVRANRDGATALLRTMPVPATAGLGSEAHDTMLGGEPAEISSFSAILTLESIVPPAGDSNGLVASSPPSLSAGPPRNYNTADPGGTGNGFGSKSAQGYDDNGTYTCPQYDTGVPDGLFYTCDRGGPTGGGMTVDLADLLALCTPTPDWFLLTVGAGWRGADGAGGSGTAVTATDQLRPCEPPTPSGISGGCGPRLFPDVVFSTGGADLREADGITVPPTRWHTSSGDSGSTPAPCYIKPPSSDYVGAPGYGGPFSAVPPSLLWRKDQAAGVSWEWTIGPEGGILLRGLAWSMDVKIIPFYEVLPDGLHNGDVLNLDGSGWEGTLGGPVMWIA